MGGFGPFAGTDADRVPRYQPRRPRLIDIPVDCNRSTLAVGSTDSPIGLYVANLTASASWPAIENLVRRARRCQPFRYLVIRAPL